MRKEKALARLEKIEEAISWLSDDYIVININLDDCHSGTPSVHIDRYQYDGKDETALMEYGKVCGYKTEFVENYTKHYDGVLVYDPNGVLLYQLINEKREEGKRDG